MKLHFFSIILLSFCLTSQNVVGQVIHKNDLENFIGVIKTTPVNEPDTWPEDSLFYSSLPLENHFTHYAIGSTYKEMTEKYPYDWNTNETYSIAFWPNSRLVRSLEVHEKDWMLVAFHNGGYESGASFLTLWEVQGDSLNFRYLFSNQFITGIGSAQLEQNYIIDVYQNLIFVVKDYFADGHKSRGKYHFIALDHENNLYPLLKREFRSNLRSESYILYKFLWREDLLIQSYEFSKTLYFEEVDGRKRQLTDRTLENSNHEVIDLIDLVKNARSQDKTVNLTYAEFSLPYDEESQSRFRMVEQLFWIAFSDTASDSLKQELIDRHNLIPVKSDSPFLGPMKNYLDEFVLVYIPDNEPISTFISDYPRPKKSDEFGNQDIIKYTMPVVYEWSNRVEWWIFRMVTNGFLIRSKDSLQIHQFVNENNFDLISTDKIPSKHKVEYPYSYQILITPKSNMNLFEAIKNAAREFDNYRIYIDEIVTTTTTE